LKSIQTIYNLSGGFSVRATFEETVARECMDAIVGEIVQSIAAKYVEEHYAEITAKLDQNAIANLAVAESGKKIAEEIRTRPVVLHDGQKTTVNKYSIF
jgi:hypothetical protein